MPGVRLGVLQRNPRDAGPVLTRVQVVAPGKNNNIYIFVYIYILTKDTWPLGRPVVPFFGVAF